MTHDLNHALYPDARGIFKTIVAALLLLALGCSGGHVDTSNPGAMPNAMAPVPRAATVYVLIEFLQQSNGTGTDRTGAPADLPDPAIPFWVNDFYYNDGTHVFGGLDVRTAHNGFFSHELQTALRLKAAGYQVAVIKLTRGATYINRWPPGKPLGDTALAELSEAWAALPAEFPEATNFEPIWIADHGEAEARYFDRPTVEKWSGYFLQVQAGIEGIVGPLSPYVVRTCSTISGKTFIGVLEAQQASVAAPGHLIWTDDLMFRDDGVHRTGASQNIVGDRLADAILPSLPPPN